MDINLLRVEKQGFTTPELLRGLSENEGIAFLESLHKLRIYNHELPEKNERVTALCCMLVDKLHESHTKELSTALTLLLNKLVQGPFQGDREILKSVLEALMSGVAKVEEQNK